ncbi:MAG: dihydrolipoyl dehydrogenase [Candidatus Omnitrophota bacterium]
MYDLTVIGSGWAGFNAALRAKESGLKVCLIERAQIGGTCLNLGCIPTKTLIQSAKVYSLARKSAVFGLEPLSPQINFEKLQERKENIIRQLASGIQFMLKGIDVVKENAKLLSPEEIQVGSQKIQTKFILIATGSTSIEFPFLKFDNEKVISSDTLLNIKRIPATLLIIGGGVIGCEFASLFCAFGSQVTVVEKMPQLLPGEDREVARKLETIFKKKGIKVNTDTDASSVNINDFELVLVSVGRVPRTEGLELETLGVKTERGRVVVDEYLRTNIPNIFAAGDCTGKKMLAHFAAYQGCIAADNMAHPDQLKKAEDASVPNCIFTDPEIASVGMNEEQAHTKGIDIEARKFDFLGSGMARILDEADGFIKIISDKKTEEVLGASIVGPKATELIACLTLAVSNHLKASSIRNTIFAHPTLSESIHEAIK